MRFKQYFLLKSWTFNILILTAILLVSYQRSPYKLDFKTMYFERIMHGNAHSFVRSVHVTVGQSLGASYTSNGVILIWSLKPFEIIYELPFAHTGTIQLSWQDEELLIDTDTQHYTFTLKRGLSAAQARNKDLKPNYQILKKKEIDRLGLPKDTRIYHQSKKGTFGLLSDGSLIKQSGILREIIPAEQYELNLIWSEYGTLIAEQSRSKENYQSTFHWFPANDNASHLNWNDHAWRTIYWDSQPLGHNLLSKSKYNYTVSVSRFTPQENKSQPIIEYIENWKKICPPRASNIDKKIAYSISGINRHGHFTTDNKAHNNIALSSSKTERHLRFETIACAKDYAIGVVNKLGQSQLYLIKLDDLSIESYPFELDHYLTTNRLSLNNKKQLAVPLRKGLYILSPSDPPLHVPIKAWTATPSPDDSKWLVSTIDGMTLLVDAKGQITPIYGPKGVNQVHWPHPRIITWNGWSAGMMIAPLSGNFTSNDTQIVYYRPRLKRFEYAKGSQRLNQLPFDQEADRPIKTLLDLIQ